MSQSSMAANSHVARVEAQMAEFMKELKEARKRDEEEKKLAEERRVLWTTPFSLFFRYPYFTLNPYWTSTSILSPSSPTSLDLLYDSFYESFLFLAYDLFV